MQAGISGTAFLARVECTEARKGDSALAKLIQISPIIPVTSVAAAAEFFCETLGFRLATPRDDVSFAVVARDEARFSFVPAPPDADMDDEARQCSAYVTVDDVGELWVELEAALSRLPKGRIRAPFDQAYGMREFHVIYESLLIFFASPIAQD